MSKKIKKSVGQSQRHSVDMPNVVDMDILAYSSDDELRERYGYLNSMRESVVRSGYDAQPWEVELAYIQREVGIRESRRFAHDRYIRSNPDNTQFDAYDVNSSLN